tara:strand:+ start:783 stop:1076 length:294 start_codon:yes stop_codon:yes gene_type:complete
MKDGQPYDHPILEDNFHQAFPEIDVNTLPPEFAKFERVQPTPDKYQKVGIVTYGVFGDIVRDVWEYLDMTDEEKAEVDAIISATNVNASGSEPDVIG